MGTIRFTSIRLMRSRGLFAILPASLLTMLFVALPATGARAADSLLPLLPLWRVSGQHNNVYLLGSIHLLRESDYPLPAGIDDAYADAEQLVMELDMDDQDPAAAGQLVQELGIIHGSDTLESTLGADAWQQAGEYAAKAGIALDLLQRTEPWFAAINAEQMILQRLGYNPAFGVEARLAERAAVDGKPIAGLETLRQQLTMLDRLPAAAQRDLLLQSLEDGAELGTIMDELVAAWRRGDVGYVDKTMLQDMQGYPALYRALVTRRNNAWLRPLEDLLDDRDDYLVVVGMLHLIGNDGVPRLLSRRGYTVSQLHDRPASRN